MSNQSLESSHATAGAPDEQQILAPVHDNDAERDLTESVDAIATATRQITHQAAACATSRVIAKAMATITVDPLHALCAPYAFLPPRLDNIPQELREHARWAGWRAKGAPGQKPIKVPRNAALRNENASSNDPSTWSTFAQAEAAYAEGGNTGIGFMLNNDGIVGVDIDKCVVDGVIELGALALMEMLGVNYVELSPSGTGLRGFGYGDALEKGTSGTFDGLHVELYSTVRFLTVTGLAVKNLPLGPLVGFKDLADRIRADRKTDQVTGEVLDVPAAERQAELLKRIVSGARYHDSLRDLAASHVASGMHAGAVVNNLRAIMANVVAPHDERWQERYDSIPGLVNSATAKYANHGVDTSGIINGAPPLKLKNDVQLPRRPTISLQESTANRLFVGKPKAMAWLVEGIFPQAKAIILASPPGVGKSYMSLNLAVAVASAPSALNPAFCFGGQVKAHGRVVIVSAEDDHEELHRRLAAITIQMPERLHVVSLPDAGHFSFLQGDSRSGMTPTAQWSDLKAQIEALDDVRLVIVDTLQALSCGDMNAAEVAQAMMNELTEVANRTGAAVIALHHLTKGTADAQRGMLSAQSAMDSIRGSGAIVGAVRAAYCLFPHPNGKKVCEAMGIPFVENKVIYGLVAKANGPARRDRSIYIRSESGLLDDRTLQYKRALGEDNSLLESELFAEIMAAHAAGNGFSASTQSKNGLHKRREELPKQFQNKPAAWFEEVAMRLVQAGKIAEKKITNGFKFVPLAELNDPEMPYAPMPDEAESIHPFS